MADEVKALSTETSHSTKEVFDMADGINSVSTDIEKAINESNSSLQQIKQGSLNIDNAVQEQRAKTLLVESVNEQLAQESRELTTQINLFLSKIRDV